MRKTALVVILVFSLSMFSGCAGMQQQGGSGSNVGYCALMGSGAGAGIGALTNTRRPLKNAIIGALIGAVAGAVTCDIIEKKAQQAAFEAAQRNQVVEYRTDQGQRVRATPAGYSQDNGCREVINEAFDTDGTSLGKVPRTICSDQNGNMAMEQRF